MFYPSANRDDEVFADAGRFDVTREPNPHLAFGGGGRHFCLGASLARLEIRVLFEELLRRLPDIELDGAPRRLRSNFINGIKTLPVRYTPQRG
jgi:cholest-4-en-3-one 26-monooxygenase